MRKDAHKSGWRWYWLAFGLFAVVIAAQLMLRRAERPGEPARPSMPARETAPGIMDGPPVQVAFRHATGRPDYRYSVIPSGAGTIEELDDARARDPVVTAHYAGFDVASSSASAGTRDDTPVEGAPEPETAALFLGAAALLYLDRERRKRGSGK